MIRFSCPGCGAVYSVTDDKAGKTGKCPKCQTPFTIPAAEAPAPAPPPVSSNPFSDLSGEDDAPRKKKAPSKAADLDDAPPKKKPARRDDDSDDAPPKKKAKGRRDDDDYDDDAPPKKKPARRDEEDDDDDDRPKKKARRDDEEDDDDDRPRKKKPARSADDDYDDDYDDRPRKTSRSRRGDDYDDDYDDRPRKKKGKSLPPLLLVAAILDIVAAALLLTNGLRRLFQVLDLPAALLARVPEVGTYFMLLKISLIAGVLGAGVAVSAAVAAFLKKKWFGIASFIASGLLFLTGLVYLSAMFIVSKLEFDLEFILMLLLVPVGAGVVSVLAATNRNVKRVLS